MTRWDESWHRLREWTNGSGQAERLAAQIVLHQGYAVDPSHPLGGPDGGKDAICEKAGARWIMAVYFPRGQKEFAAIVDKFQHDLTGVVKNGATGVAFVTNQELRLHERAELSSLADPVSVDLFHLERVTAILDNPAMHAVREQFLGIPHESEDLIFLGGEGGKAPGAGGGGGAAIGSGAQGGHGGRGGDIAVLDGQPGELPGAGGGGGGAVGEGMQAGGGGGGGEQIQVEVSPEELSALRASGFHHLELRVGQGGRDSGPGEDSIVNFVTADGKILRSIIARGGAPGDPVRMPIPQGRYVTAGDIEAGFQISSLLLADCVHIRQGLFFLLSAGWAWYTVTTNPFRVDWPLACSAAFGRVDPNSVVRLSAVVRDPRGFQVLEVPFAVTGATTNTSVKLEFSGSEFGDWLIEIMSAETRLAKLPIKIQLQV